jgi:uncharacterized DUF497 family protein
MRFVWDEDKNQSNLARHNVSFELASLVFQDPLQISEPDPHESEERWRTLGLVKGVVVLIVVHTIKEDEDGYEEIRIISARKATRAEREAYEESH